ncbi:efflux RND transporter permease subunit [Zavarzinella formosa]|uniref:efflux RND transporter permease subunit n=1 Tax=Zavarzinella formosa TaxID=360055 RepID=UPI00031AC498|nr:efflux RND transporter permease subunit [Zavarzinella formosa]
MFTRFFIDRPIFASVLSIIIVLAGTVALFTLPVAQYPEITPPTVEVSAVYPGANARTVGDTVAAPIEQQVNGVEDMMYMTSRSTNDGGYTLTVTFKPGTDLNIAQVLVQNRVNLAQPVLPDLVKRRGVLVKKKSPTVLMIINLFSPDATRDNLYLSNYATIQLRDELSRVSGVGDITYLGQRDYSMRLWLDPEKMTIRGLSATDVIHAIEQQNAQVAAGQIGQPPVPNGQSFQYTINTLGRLADEDQFSDMILKSDDNGRVVRMRDVARVELGATGYDQTCTLDGKPSVALSVYQLPGSNAIDTAKDVRKKMEDLKARFPQGVDYAIVYDTTPFIDESVKEVFKTLFDAVVLVGVVMLVFLQSWRAAIIPLAAVPVAIVGTFGAMAVFGYSLNNLTLFGLVLAVGIVVDDAIVVVEAVQHHIDHGMRPRDATAQAMDEVSGPVIAVGLVLAAVFIPCVFISGIIGQFFRQFAVTIAVSTLISAFNSLTLSPALCALLLKKGDEQNHDPLPKAAYFSLAVGLVLYFGWTLLPERVIPKIPLEWAQFVPQRFWSPIILGVTAFAGGMLGWYVSRPLNFVLAMFFRWFNVVFDFCTGGYLLAVRGLLRVTILPLAVYGVLIYLTITTFANTPSGFIPPQDKGYLLVNVQLPDSASVTRTEQVMRRIETIAREMPGVSHTVAIGGQSVQLGANAPNFGTVYVMLDPFGDRLESDRSADAIAAKLQGIFSEQVPGALLNVFSAPAVDGLGTSGGFSLVIQDPSDVDPMLLQASARQVVAAASDVSDLRNCFTGYRADTPWLKLEVDRVAAKSMNVSVAEIINTLQVYFGSLYVNDFNKFGRTWQVNVQADNRFRKKAEDLKSVHVRNDSGEMVPVAAFLSVKEATGPVMIQRYNLYPAATVNVDPAVGVSSGQAINTAERIANQELLPGLKSEWTELALLQLQTKDTAMKAFLLAVVLAFLVLAAQYESWALPLAVILVVPMCLLSAGIGIRLAGQDINIFTQVGFIVLVGLACKNAILIVEFAKQKREEGMPRREATLQACKLRLRPIIMTSVAFIFGVVPLLIAEGAGAEMRRALGTAVFAGMTGVTVFGLFLTPVFYYTIQWVKDRWDRKNAEYAAKMAALESSAETKT